MKKLIILCSVVFLFASVTAFKVEEKAEFKFEKETHDFGKIHRVNQLVLILSLQTLEMNH